MLRLQQGPGASRRPAIVASWSDLRGSPRELWHAGAAGQQALVSATEGGGQSVWFCPAGVQPYSTCQGVALQQGRNHSIAIAAQRLTEVFSCLMAASR